MAGASKDDDDLITAINVTPLVDIILVLLIIFMVTTEVIHESERPDVLPIELPAAASSEQMLSRGLLSFVIDGKGELWLNGVKTTYADVPAVVAKVKQSGITAQALISADERVSHGAVVDLMDRLRLEGVRQMAINTKKQAIE